jgi:hypothetical protein
MLARYSSLSLANYSVIHPHFVDVWRFRGKMTFAPLKDNFFIITFSSEGDYNFVNGGGPWIHLGTACLIAPFVDERQPSETVLNSVRLWVRFYDVPWNKQTDAYGRLIGSKFGKVVEVDVDKDGIVLSDYLRVRIDWPLNQHLFTRFKTTVKGQTSPRIYPMRYERVPFFCLHCSTIGHNEEQCERLMRGEASLNYELTLRCSPKRKYEGRAISTPDGPPTKKSLPFNTSEGSVNSLTLGMPKRGGATASARVQPLATDIPPPVDAFDGFDVQERQTNATVEEALANTVQKMELQFGKRGSMPPCRGPGSGTEIMPGTPNFMQGGPSSNVQLEVTPEAMQMMHAAQMSKGVGRDTLSGPHSSDMIPVLKGLSNASFSQNTDSDVSMTDSVLGKRGAEDSSVQGAKIDLSLALNVGG